MLEKLRARLPEVWAELGIKPFKYRVETDLLAYGDGAGFTRHVDARPDTGDEAKPRVDRRISAVYYFFKEPKIFSGGQLRLYPLFSGDPIDIEPVDNMMIVFPSFAPHEVLSVVCPSKAFADSRFAVNFWLSVR